MSNDIHMDEACLDELRSIREAIERVLSREKRTETIYVGIRSYLNVALEAVKAVEELYTETIKYDGSCSATTVCPSFRRVFSENPLTLAPNRCPTAGTFGHDG